MHTNFVKFQKARMLRSIRSKRSGILFGAGWSSPVARQAHNLKVAGSNPAPATKEIKQPSLVEAVFLCPELGAVVAPLDRANSSNRISA